MKDLKEVLKESILEENMLKDIEKIKKFELDVDDPKVFQRDLKKYFGADMLKKIKYSVRDIGNTLEMTIDISKLRTATKLFAHDTIMQGGFGYYEFVDTGSIRVFTA